VHPARFFSPEPTIRRVALKLYELVKDAPLICPHTHVNPALFAEEKASFGTPADLFIIPDHYIFRMLYSQGIRLETLGIPNLAGRREETSPRKIWQIFAKNFYLFRGTPSGAWLEYELSEVFGIKQKLNEDTAEFIYEELAKKLNSPEFSPRRLFERFKIKVLATTDFATDSLTHHRQIKNSGWEEKIIPTFRPDEVVNHLHTPNWRKAIKKLEEISKKSIENYPSFVEVIEERRKYFKEMGAVATDSATLTAFTQRLPPAKVNSIFQKGLRGKATEEEAVLFTAHFLMEMARMSVEDGLVMQLHIGVLRNHNPTIYQQFGSDKGADIPVQTEITRCLKPLLNQYGNSSRLTLILFTLDEDVYARELAPLAGHYPALKLGPPWWFHDSLNGIERYLERVVETAGIYNLAGFNDDTRAFPSIPARHDLWRRACANWLAKLTTRHIVSFPEAEEMIKDLAYRLAEKAYHL
jgi:glucuronate isomerase